MLEITDDCPIQPLIGVIFILFSYLSVLTEIFVLAASVLVQPHAPARGPPLEGRLHKDAAGLLQERRSQKMRLQLQRELEHQQHEERRRRVLLPPEFMSLLGRNCGGAEPLGNETRGKSSMDRRRRQLLNRQWK